MDIEDKARTVMFIALCCAASFFLYSCQQKPSSSTQLEAPLVDVTGTWLFTIEDSDSISQLPNGYSIDLDLAQSGAIVSGAALTSDGRTGSVSGKVSGEIIVDFKIFINPNEDLWLERQIMNGTATVSGNTMALNLTLDLGTLGHEFPLAQRQAQATKVK